MAYSKVVWVIHVLPLDAVSGADSPVLTVDGGTAEVERRAEGEVLEAELVRKLSWSGFSTSDDPVQASAELRLSGGGGCVKE